MILCHGGVTPVSVLTHLRREIHLRVNAVEAEWSHAKQPRCPSFGNVIVRRLVELIALPVVIHWAHLVVYRVQGLHKVVTYMSTIEIVALFRGFCD